MNKEQLIKALQAEAAHILSLLDSPEVVELVAREVLIKFFADDSSVNFCEQHNIPITDMDGYPQAQRYAKAALAAIKKEIG